MDTDYKLIQAVDPTKIRVNIKEKFAKLTLSSNKKKKEEETDAGNIRDLEACKRISRNLLEDLQKAEDCEQRKESYYVNPLLRSDSPSDCDSTQHNKTHNDIELSFDMEPLRVIGLTQENENENRQSNDQRFNEVAELLSEQVSCLSLNSKVITESSDSGKQEAVPQPHSHPQQLNLINPPEVSICISTSTEEESDDAITISDSSESNESKDYDLVTSNIPQSGETANALLPSTISNDKADLIEAFLRDVSQARREKLLSDVESFEFNLQQEQNSRKEARNLAAADTESMSADILSDFNREVKEEQTQSELDDTEAMSETRASMFQSNDVQANLHSSPATSDNQEKHRDRELAADDTIPNTELEAHPIQQRPIAEADTIPNTDFDAEINDSIESVQDLVDLADTIPNSNESLPTIDDSLVSNAKYDDSLESTHISALPEESITILETSSEDEEDASAGRVSSPHSASPATTKSSKQSMTPDIQSEDSSVIQHHQNMPSINISAKINIKIHISEVASSNGDDEDDDNDDDDESESDQNNDESPPLPDAQRNQSADDEAQSLSDTQQSFRPDNENDLPVRNQSSDHSSVASEQSAAESNQSPTEIHSEKLAIDSPSARPPPPVEPIEQEEAGFMEHAQKLLNQLYGNAWQTPEVIRTLHRTRFEPQQQKKPELGGGAKLNSVKSPAAVNPINQTAEESVLDDFSIFRRNIKTNLDSTRRVEQPTPLRVRVKNLNPRNINSEKRTRRRSPLVSQNQRRVPQTEVKKRSQKVGQFNERWRQLVDDDDESDGANASDDEAPDKTIDAVSEDDDDDEEKNSDKSWSKNSTSSSSSDDDDDDEDFTKRRQRTTRRNVTPRVAAKGKQNTKTRKDKNQLIYMDLSKQEVEIVEGTPVANNEEQLQQSLRHILNSNKYEEPPKLEATPNSTKTRRKLFTAHFGNEIGNVDCETPKAIPFDSPVDDKQTPQADKENVNLSCQPMPAIFTPFNKKLESVRTGTPIFKIQTPKSTVKNNATRKEGTKNTKDSGTNSETPKDKYGFLKSLDVCVGKSLCHPDALQYRDNYRQKKEELGKRLYDLYNEKLFDNKLQVPLVWNKKLINTAGRCLNKKKLSVRTSVVELSEKVLTSADRLRCTLIHELCHAATWIFHGEGGHGATWKSWAHKANSVFPEIPKIGVCHQYDIEYKYTYKCTLCAAKSHAHSKSKKVENIRCSYCHGAIEIFLNKKDKEGNIIPTPVREPTGFAKFVKEKYKEYKNPTLKHTDVMKILSNEFALLKVTKGN